MNKEDLLLVKERLGELGIEIRSAHDLYMLATDEDRNPIEVAIPVLIELLPCLGTSSAKGEVAHALAVKESHGISASPLVTELKKLRQDIENEAPYSRHLGWEIGNALADVANISVYDELVDILCDRAFGKSRKMLPYALARVKERREKTIAILLRVLQDEDVTAHAIDALGRLKATEALPEIRAYLDSPTYLVKKEAKKAVRKLENYRDKRGRAAGPKKRETVKPLPPGAPETSINVDLCEIPRLLGAVAAEIGEGFESREIELLEDALLMMEVDEERLFEYKVLYGDSPEIFQIGIFMDDKDSPDFFFRGAEPLISAIGRLLGEWT